MGSNQQQDAGGDSVLLHILTSRHDRKDTRVFAHAAAETQTVIHETYQQQQQQQQQAAGTSGRPSSRATGRAGANAQAQESGFLEVFPRVASRPPKLLQELESILIDRLRNNDKAVSIAPLVTKDRDPGMAANLSLDAHRHVFGAFIEGFGTYTSLLSRVQEDFEAALDQGIRCSMENQQMRVRIAEEEAKRLKAQSELRSKIMQGELEYRKAAFARLQELKIRMDRAVKKASIVEREMDSVKQDEVRMQALVAKLRQQHQNLLDLHQQEAAWAAQPNSSMMEPMKIGKLTSEDEVWLEAEYLPSSVMKPSMVSGNLLSEQELRHFMATRKEAFISIFQMAASKSRHRGQRLPQGLASKTGVAHVVQRCVPSASDHDMRYALLLVDAVLPRNNAVSIKDLAYAVKQGAMVERLAGSCRLPPGVRGVMSALAGEFHGRHKLRVRKAFASLDFNDTGALTAPEQVQLLHALAPSLTKTELLWLSACLYWYAEQDSSTAGLSYDELAEALTWLAHQQPGSRAAAAAAAAAAAGQDGDEAWMDGQQGPEWHGDGWGYHPQQQLGQQGQMGGGGPAYMDGFPSPGYSSGSYYPSMAADPYSHQPYPYQQHPFQQGGGAAMLGGGPHTMRDGQWLPGGEFLYTGYGGSPLRVHDDGVMQGGGMLGGGTMPLAAAREAGEDYCAWVARNRQKVLEQWFAEDHARKVRVLEVERDKLLLQQKLKSEIFTLKKDARAVEAGMMSLARQTERNAWELTGQLPVLTLDLKGLTERVHRTMDEAVKITRSRDLAAAAAAGVGLGGDAAALAAGGEGAPAGVEAGLSLEELLERLTSSDWLARVRLPESARVLKLALDMRSNLLALQRMQRSEAVRLELDKKRTEMEAQEARHGQALQAALLQQQLANQATELQRRLLYDAQLVTSVQHQQQAQQQVLQLQQQQGTGGFAATWPTMAGLGVVGMGGMATSAAPWNQLVGSGGVTSASFSHTVLDGPLQAAPASAAWLAPGSDVMGAALPGSMRRLSLGAAQTALVPRLTSD